MAIKLTAKFVEKAKHTGAGHFTDFKDDSVHGLYLRVLASGAKRWVLLYRINGRRRRPVIGTYPTTTLADARAKAQGWWLQIKEGIDPQALADKIKEERASMPTVADFADTYIERYAKPNKKSWAEDRRILNKYVLPVIGELPTNEVHRRDVLALVDKVRDTGRLVQANRVLAVVRKLFNFAVERAVLEASPVVGIRATRERPRERVLSDEELRTLWEATAPNSKMQPATRLALRLLALTGARSGEVCGIKPSEINIDKALWTLPAARSKNGLTHTVPLSADALKAVTEALSHSGSEHYLFPAARGSGHLTGYALTQVMERIFPTDDHPTVHDIRRTVGTRLSESNNRLIVDKVLNHKDSSVGGIYDRYTYDSEKRHALEGWARKLHEILTGGSESPVVELKAG